MKLLDTAAVTVHEQCENHERFGVEPMCLQRCHDPVAEMKVGSPQQVSEEILARADIRVPRGIAG